MSLTDALNWATAQLNPYVLVAIFGGYFLVVGRMLYLTQRPPRSPDSPWERARKEAEAEMEAELARDAKDLQESSQVGAAAGARCDDEIPADPAPRPRTHSRASGRTATRPGARGIRPM